MIWRTLLCCAAAVFFASPLHAAEGIDCIYDALTPLQRDELMAEGSSTTSDATSAALSTALAECSERHKWPPEANEDAVFYTFARANGDRLRRQSSFSVAEIVRIDRAYESMQAQLRPVLWPAIEAGMRGEPEPEMTRQQNAIMGRFIIRAGIVLNEATSRELGELLGSRAMVEVFAERFAGY